MRFQSIRQKFREVPRLGAAVRHLLPGLVQHSTARSRLFIVVTSVLVCAYALGVICSVLAVPDIGVRCAFSTEVEYFFPEVLYPAGQEPPQPDDVIVRVGGRPVENWPQYLRCLAG